MNIPHQLSCIKESLEDRATLVAVSKTHTADKILEAYNCGQRIFAENRPQELKAKYNILPKDIEWHHIGHLQTNKVRSIIDFVSMIESIDSLRILEFVNKEAERIGRKVDILLEVHIAIEETKHGWSIDEICNFAAGDIHAYKNVNYRGLMTIASNSDDESLLRSEFNAMKSLFDQLKPLFGESFDTLSMGMTSDYMLAIECGSNMVRIGSKIFGDR